MVEFCGRSRGFDGAFFHCGGGFVGIDDEELGQLLVDAGMPRPEIPALIGQLNRHWARGGSIDALLADDAVLRSWRLSPGSLMLLRSIFGIAQDTRRKRGRDEFASTQRIAPASTALVWCLPIDYSASSERAELSCWLSWLARGVLGSLVCRPHG